MGSKIKDVGKVKEIPFGPQLPTDGPYKYRRPWQSWTGGDKVKKKNEFTTGGKTYKYAKGGRAGYKSGTTLAELEKEKSGSDKKIDKFAFVHIEKMKKKKKETGPGSSNPKRVQRNLGGRMGYKDGSKCKLATKGKGRAYGKNS